MSKNAVKIRQMPMWQKGVYVAGFGMLGLVADLLYVKATGKKGIVTGPKECTIDEVKNG